MEKAKWFDKAVQAIMDTDEEAARKVASDSLEAGMDPLEMINKGFTEGIRRMGDLFERGEVFLPGLIIQPSRCWVATRKIPFQFIDIQKREFLE